MATPDGTLRVLSIGLDAISKAAVERVFAGRANIEEAPTDLEKILELPTDPQPHMVICGPPPQGATVAEFAQALRMQYQDAPIFYITSSRAGFDRKEFKKQGFTDGFLMPIDIPVLETVIFEALATASKGQIKAYRSVKLVDLAPGAVMDFDTYIHLPSNKKYVKYTGAGTELSEEQVARFKKKSLTEMQVSHDQIQKFYQFTANQLKNIEKNGALSETERRDRIQTAIRDIMGGIFSDSTKDASTSHGKQMVSDCQEIVKAYIVGGGTKDPKGSWYEKLMNLTGQGGSTYSHAANVATFAVMFSMGTGIGKPDEIGIAGVLHDIGLADVPMEIQQKKDYERTKEETELYQKHPEKSLILIKERKLVVSETVIKAITQHHEHFSGRGYPKGMAGNRICPEAQILGIADEFDYLMAGQNVTGKKMSPAEALKHIIHNNVLDQRFDPEIMAKIATLFPELRQSAAPQAPAA